MEITFKAAEAGHAGLLVEMMREFYAHDRHPFDAEACLSALGQILADASLGRVYLMLSDGEVAGYIVLTTGFSLEYHGRNGFVDEIYVKPSYRGRGIGRQGLQFIEGVCRELGLRALHLEVERTNSHAQAVYLKAGFVSDDRLQMSKRLS